MQCCAFQAHYRHTGIFDELVNIHFAVIIFLVLERWKSAMQRISKYCPKYRRRIFHMLNCIAAHDGALFKLKRPAFFIYIEYDGFHA
jgi:hypothetical protein